MEIDIAQFIFNWYTGKRNSALSVLPDLAKEFPYSGKAFRATDNKKGETPFVKPPTSWGKSQKLVEDYAKQVSSDVEGYLVEGYVNGIDLEKAAKDILPYLTGNEKNMAKAIIHVKEVIALSVSGVKIIKFIEKT